jgi:predicted DNA-binding transcriptional regulator AlpA
MGERSLRNGPDKYISAKDAAKYFGLTITEFLDQVKAGDIPPPYKLGLLRRWKEPELVALQKNSKRS